MLEAKLQEMRNHTGRSQVPPLHDLYLCNLHEPIVHAPYRAFLFILSNDSSFPRFAA